MQDDENNNQGGSADGEETPDSAVHYIAAITAELVKIARRNRLDTLGYLLEMAWLEADRIKSE